ncbi:MAG TPA: hypothetical protein VMB51_09205 [Solirubrobacteraceae bacterium]|nr:hypothetical protein [Solirubrobacteraceae bacterium]
MYRHGPTLPVGRRGAARRPPGRWLAVVLAAALALALVGSQAAWGLSARGHVLGFAFHGSGEGALNGPTQVAVNEASGEVFVVEPAAERVVRFVPSGGSYEAASVWKVPSPGAIAVDNSGSPSDLSAGDVYVAGAKEAGAEASERDFIYKFAPDGERLLRKGLFKAHAHGEPVELELEGIRGLSVDESGRLWTYWEEWGDISAFGDAASMNWLPELTPEGFEGAESLLEECSAGDAFATDGSGGVFYAGFERENGEEECPGEEEQTPDAQVVAKLSLSSQTLAPREMDRQDTSGVAVEAGTGTVYLDNGSDVAAYTSSGGFVQRFGEGTLSGASGVAVDAETGDVFVAEPGEGAVDVFVPAAAGAPAVDGVSAAAVSPSSEELRGEIDPNGAQTEWFFEYGTSDCVIDPSACTTVPIPSGVLGAGFGDQTVTVTISGLAPATDYYYALVAKSALGGPVVAAPATETFQTLPSASVLPDGRAWEMVSPPDKHDAAVEALPREGGALIEAAAQGGALTWVANGPLVGEPAGSRNPEPTQLLSTRSSEGWSTQDLETSHARGGGVESTDPIGAEYQAFSSDLSLALLEPAEPQVSGTELGVREEPPLAPGALEKTIYLRDNPPLAPGAGEQAAYEGAEANRAFMAPGYLPLVDAADDTANAKFGGGLMFLGATSDLSHVLFSSRAGLLSAPGPGAGGLYEWSAGGPLQLVSVLPNGEPAGEAVLGGSGELGAASGLNARAAISTDGSRVIWTVGAEGLYLRDSESGETVKVNAAQGNGATEPGPGGAVVAEPAAERQEVHFQTASSDGSRVFFTDTASLTSASTLEPVGGTQGPADLYEFELTSARGQPLQGTLSDLTPEGPYGAADVLGLLPGASEDGSTVYFVANGALTPNAQEGACPRYYGEETRPPAGATCNLYVAERASGEWTTKLIAPLSYEDGADWGAGQTSRLVPEQDLSGVSSRVSPNGRYLAFMSQRSLTGYDNEDVTSEAPGERMDEEVYLYDAQTGRLTCASCNPSGQRPAGVFDTKLAGEGLALLVDRPEIWLEHWLAGSLPDWMLDYGREKPAVYQARYLSNDGRLFFNSPDALVPADQNDKEDVYEYEPQDIGSCAFSAGCVGLISSGTSSHESVFLDASETGDEAFFITAAPLVAADRDSAYDVYDARVCGEASPCIGSSGASTQGCESTVSCRPGVEQPPTVAAAAPSETYTGPGNPTGQVLSSKTAGSVKPRTHSKTMTNRQMLAKALTACHRIKQRHARLACEKRARRRYPLARKQKKTRGSRAAGRARRSSTRRSSR